MAYVVPVVLLLAALTLGGFAVSLYNRLVFLKNQCEKSWFNIDVILKQRHDELPKLISVCEGSMKFERDTLEAVIRARQTAVAAGSVGDRARAEGELSGALGKLFAVAEQYPELKTVQLFAQISSRVSGLEGEIADRREFYNDAVMNFNVAIESFPSNFVASFAGLRQRELFRVAEGDKADVAIKFSFPGGAPPA
ncbi:MAG: LemA family protein [Candidatus Coatesbacteria bacterium]